MRAARRDVRRPAAPRHVAEVVEALVARGMNVHYLLRGDRYWSNVLDEQESRIVEHRLQEEGVELAPRRGKGPPRLITAHESLEGSGREN